MADIGRDVKPISLDDLPADLDPRLRAIFEQIIYSLDLREGRVGKGTNARFVTIGDLVEAGVVPDGAIE